MSLMQLLLARIYNHSTRFSHNDFKIHLLLFDPDAPATSCIPLTIRPSLVYGCVLRLRDKSSIVRKKAVELLSAFLETHPFIGVATDLGAVSEKRFQSRVDELDASISAKIDSCKRVSQVAAVSNQDDTPPAEQLDEDDVEIPPELQQELNQMQALLKYYQDALSFAKLLNQSCPVVCDLLESSLKTEVVGALKFFVVAHRYEVEGAAV
jgi:condensin complex subunit 1